jgi:hypothetical protein
MQRMIITQRDVEQQVQTLAKPFEEKAKDIGLPPSTLDIKAAVATPVPNADDYQSRLLKYIPAEVIAVYLTLDNALRSAKDQIALQSWLWIIFGILLVGTPLYLWRVSKVTKKVQLLISTIAFAVWVFALGGAFALQSWYHPVYGALLLPLYTFFVPVISGG